MIESHITELMLKINTHFPRRSVCCVIFIITTLAGWSHEFDIGDQAKMRQYVQSVPQDELVKVFMSGLLDHNGRPMIFYHELLERDLNGEIKNKILELVTARSASPGPGAGDLLVAGGGAATTVAARFLGQEAVFRDALLKVVVDINAQDTLLDPDRGKSLLNRSATIDFVLRMLAENEDPGALATILAIEQNGQLERGTRVTLYLALAGRYNSFEKERENILSILSDYLRKETDLEILNRLAAYSVFKRVRAALLDRGTIVGNMPAEKGTTDRSLPRSTSLPQESKVTTGTNGSGNEKLLGDDRKGSSLLWPGLIFAFGLASLFGVLAVKFQKRTR